MSERFETSVQDPAVARDCGTLADFVGIWCDGHHCDRARRQAETEAAQLGIYGRKRPVLCEECEAHLAYAEKRRAFCTQDPKPFCAHCEVHCYRPDEREWQRTMMRYAGPRSWRKGHAIDGVKHVLEARKYRKRLERRAAETTTAPHTGTEREELR